MSKLALWFLILGRGIVSPSIQAATPGSPGPITSNLPGTDCYGDPLPPGAIARFGTVRFRPGPHSALALSPDGKWLATGEYDNEQNRRTRHVTLWEIRTGRPFARIEIPKSTSIDLLHFRTDSKQLAVAASKRVANCGNSHREQEWICVIDVLSQQLVKGANEEFLSFNCVADSIVHFSAEKGILIRTGFHGSTGIGPDDDDETNNEIEDEEPKPKRQQRRPVVVWKPDVDKAISLDDEKEEFFPCPSGNVISVLGKSIRLIDPQPRRVLNEWERPSRAAFPVCVSPDGKKLVAFRPVKERIGKERPKESFEVVICEKGKPPSVISKVSNAFGWSGPVFSPDSQSIAVKIDDARILDPKSPKFTLWDLTTQAEVCSYPASPRSGRYEFGPDSRSIVFENDHALYILDTKTGKEKVRQDRDALVGILGESYEQSPVQWMPDGKALMAIGDVVRFLDAKTLEEQSRFHGQGNLVRAVKYSANQRWIATVSSDDRLMVWDRSTGKPVWSPAGVMVERGLQWPFIWPKGLSKDPQWNVTFVEAGERIALVAEEKLRLYRCDSGKLLHEIPLKTTQGTDGSSRRNEHLSAHCIAFNPDGSRLAVLLGDQLHIWDTRLGKRIAEHTSDELRDPSLHFSLNGRFIFARNEKRARCWDCSQSKEVIIPANLGPSGPSVSAGSNRFAYTSGRKILVWDMGLEKTIVSIESPGRLDVFAYRLSFSGSHLIVVDGEKNLRGYEVTTGREIYVVPISDKVLLDGLPTESQDKFWGVIRHYGDSSLLDLQTGRTIAKIPSDDWAISADGRILAYGDDEITLIELASGKELGKIPDTQRGVTTMAFSPDGRTLTTGGRDTTTLVWDWARAAQLLPEPRPIETSWADLSEPNSRQAYAAMLVLEASPQQAMAIFQRELKPYTKEEQQRIEAWIGQLNDDRYAVPRQRAMRELVNRGQTARPALESLLKQQLPAETENRIQSILGLVGQGQLSPEELRQVRAIQVLEWINTKDSRSLLEELAQGEPLALRSSEAKATLGASQMLRSPRDQNR